MYEKVNSVNKKCWVNFFNVPENKRLVSEHITIAHMFVCVCVCVLKRKTERKCTLNVNKMKSYL